MWSWQAVFNQESKGICIVLSSTSWTDLLPGQARQLYIFMHFIYVLDMMTTVLAWYWKVCCSNNFWWQCISDANENQGWIQMLHRERCALYNFRIQRFEHFKCITSHSEMKGQWQSLMPFSYYQIWRQSQPAAPRFKKATFVYTKNSHA